MTVIPEPARERLLQLMRLLEKSGNEPVSSARIESLTGWHSHTIRKDISYLGGGEGLSGQDRGNTQALPAGHCRFGGSSGYDPALLLPAIRGALKLDRIRTFCVVGLGRLGSAYLGGEVLSLSGGPGEFELAAGFDTNVNRVEILASRVPLYPAYKMAEVISRFGIEIALLCVPAGEAQAAAEKLAAAGIRGILNFAPVALRLPQSVTVRNVYVLDELRELVIHIPENGNEKKT